MPTETNSENPSAPPETPPEQLPETPPETPPRGNRFFSWMRSLDLPRQPGWIGGVCAGIATRIGIDPIIVRGIVVVLAILGAPLLLAYAAAWMLLPDHTGKIHAEELGRGNFEPPVAGAGLLVLLSLLPAGPGWFGEISWGLPFAGIYLGDTARAVWTLAIVAAAIWFVVWIVRRSGRGSAREADAAPSGYGSSSYSMPAASAPNAPPSSAPTDATELAAWSAQQAKFKQERDEFVKSEDEARRAAFAAHTEEQRRIREERAADYRDQRRLTRSNPLYTLVAIGLALVVGALVTLVVGDYAFTTRGLVAGLAAALAVLGTAIVINGIRGKRSGGSSGLAVVVAIALVGAGAVNGFSSVDVVDGSRFTAIAGDDTKFTPSHADGRSQDYVIGAGDAVIDLTGYWDGQTGPLDRPASVDIVGGLGDITLILPADEFVTVDSIVGWGQLSTPDRDFVRGSYDDLTLEFGPDGESAGATDRRLTLDIIVGAGDLTITTEGDR